MAHKESYERINEEAKKLLFLSDEDRMSLINNIMECNNDPLDRFIFVCFYLYGMRPSELIELKRGWITIKDQEVWLRIPTKKGGQERIIILGMGIPFIESIYEYISTISNPEASFFDFKTPSNFNHKLDRIIKRYNAKYGTLMKITPYVFRKFRLSWLLANGGSGSDLLAFKGGKSLRTLEKSYLFIRPVAKFKDNMK